MTTNLNDKNRSRQAPSKLLLGVMLLSTLGLSSSRPAAAQQTYTPGWAFGYQGEASWQSNNSSGAAGANATGSFQESANITMPVPYTPGSPGPSSLNVSASCNGVAVVNSSPGNSSSTSASASGGSTVNCNAEWENGGSYPTAGLTATATTLVMATSTAAASYVTDPGTGKVTPVGSASAGTAAGSNFASNSAVNLPANLQADSPTPDPAGLGLFTGPVSPNSEESGHEGDGSSATVLSSHTRGVGGIYQNGALAWGENVDSGLMEYTETDNFSPRYFQPVPGGYGPNYLDFHFGGGDTINASASNGSAAVTDFLATTHASLSSN